MVYLLPLIFAAICAKVYKPRRNWRMLRLLYFALFAYNVLLFGLRYRVGIDTLNYINTFAEIPDIDRLTLKYFKESTTAPLFIILMSVCKTLTGDFTVFQMTHTIILNTTLFTFLRRYSVNPFWGFFAFFLALGPYFNTEILKESLAICMFLLGYKYMVRHDWKRYYVFALLGIGFHYGATILLIMPLFQYLRFNKKFLIVCLVFYLALPVIITFTLGNIGNQALSERASQYVDMVGAGTLNMNYVYMALIQFDLVPFVVLLFGISCKSKTVSQFEPMVCAFILMGLGCISYQVMFQRFCNYFYLFFIVYLANFVTTKHKTAPFLCIFLIMLVFVPVIYSYFNNMHYIIWYPYHSILNPQSEILREMMWGGE